MDAKSSDQHLQSYEVNLFELIDQLWRSKATILMVTAVFTITGVAYAYLSTPIFQSKAVIAPPTKHNLVELTKTREILAQADHKPQATPSHPGHSSELITPDSIFSEFTQRLNSNRYKNSFLLGPELQAYFHSEHTTELQARDKFNKALSIQIPKKPPFNEITLTLNTTSEKLSSKWLNEYILYAQARFIAEQVNNIESQISATKNNLELSIKSKKENYLSNLTEEISNLEEAIEIAEEIGLVDPLNTEAEFQKPQILDQIRGIYRLGSKSLYAERKALKARAKEINNTPGLSEDKFKLELLSNINIQPKAIKVLTIDLKAESEPHPIKPNKLLIISLSVVLGGILGIIIALTSNAIRNRNPKEF